MSAKVRTVSPRLLTPVNAILIGAVVPSSFLLLVLVNPSKPVDLLWFDDPATLNARVALVSFAASGISLAFLPTVAAACIARRRGWTLSGIFDPRSRGVPVTVGVASSFGLMLCNIGWPSSLASGRSLLNSGWISVKVVVVVVVVEAIDVGIARPDRTVAEHRIEQEATRRRGRGR
jgi:hypothetical protein